MQDFIHSLKPYTKAITAFVVGCLQVLQVYFGLSTDGNLSPEDVNTLINTVIIALGGTAGVFALPNRKG